MLSLQSIKSIKLLRISLKWRSKSMKTRADNWVNEYNKYSERLVTEKSNLYFGRFHDIANNVFNWSKSVSDGSLSVDELKSEQEFQTSCDLISRSVSDINDFKLIGFLHSLLVMGLDPNTEVIRNLENEILWRSRNLSFKTCLKCLSFHHRFQETEQQKQVVNELIIRIQSNLDEAQDDDDILSILRLSKCFSKECIVRVEKTASDMIAQNIENQFKVEQLTYLLVLLAQSNRRPKPLIRAVVNKLIEMRIQQMQCPPQHLIHMIAALNALNFPDENLLQKSCDLLCNTNFHEKVSSSLKKDLLIAVSQLNWCYPRLLDSFIEKITDNPNSFSPQDLLVFVMTCARLYYRSPYMNEILNLYVIPFIKQNDMDSNSWLSYVWSLAILGNVPFGHISSVLNNEFCDQLLKNSENFEAVIIKLKLLNIKAVAEIEMGKKIDCPNCLKCDFEMSKKQNEIETFQNSIIDSLNSFMPKGKYMTTNLRTPLGFTIDAEFVVNPSNKPLPLSEYEVFGADVNKQIKPLPQGYERFALMSFGYSDTLLGSSQQIGVHELAIRLLKKLNYLVLVVNQNSLTNKMSSIKKIQYLQKSITNLFNDFN